VPSILLVRHAQASFGAADYDVLSREGLDQSAALASDLASRGLRVDRLVSGSLVRQRDTADAVAPAVGCTVAVDPRWDEYDTDDILTRHSTTPVRPSRPTGDERPRVSAREFQDLLEQALLAWVGAGHDSPTAEPWPAFGERVLAALADVAEDLTKGGTALVFTSGGVLAAVCVTLLALPDSAFVTFNRVTVNTGVTRIVYGARGAALVSFNDHAHLERGGSSLVTYR
jgi:broad specificity phosphatase PhoE